MPRSNMAALRRKNGVISGGSDDTLPCGNVRDATHLLEYGRHPRSMETRSGLVYPKV